MREIRDRQASIVAAHHAALADPRSGDEGDSALGGAGAGESELLRLCGFDSAVRRVRVVLGYAASVGPAAVFELAVREGCEGCGACGAGGARDVHGYQGEEGGGELAGRERCGDGDAVYAVAGRGAVAIDGSWENAGIECER